MSRVTATYAGARGASLRCESLPISNSQLTFTKFALGPGYCDTLKGVGRIYQQSFIDTYAKVAFAKLYDRKTPITAADLLNDRVLPFYDEHGIALCRVLTDRGTEYCGRPEHHE